MKQLKKFTKFLRNEDFHQRGSRTRQWYCIDAQDMILGRMSCTIANILRGKDKPTYTPFVDGGDYVIVINAEKVKLTADKWDKKIYYWHTGYVGGIKQIKAKDLRKKDATRIIKLAVKRMMPKNAMNRQAFYKLRVYCGSEHPHQSNNPQMLTL